MLAFKHISVGDFYSLISFSALLLLFLLRVLPNRGDRLCQDLQLLCRSFLQYSDFFFFYCESHRFTSLSASVNGAERQGVRCVVNVKICLLHRYLEDVLAQLDPASLGRRLQLVNCLSGQQRT